ncbi:hypothetical protein SSX86_013688 [Deinandra increscens subsp. villosa]|uniref:FBD domain-containing protein n=1 Tax=Deinandra increscens subsp. villosa TaxID=3103831 RepID=A0AAP0D230_9ASTR
MDRISNLPLGIIETILCLLPIEEAARTSILSTGWRYLWIKIPKLAFYESKFEVAAYRAEPSVLERTFDMPSKRKDMATRCTLFYAIYQVLLIHQGLIREFALSMKADESCVEIDHIILNLSMKKTVKILKLELKRRYKLPKSFFSLHQLTDLHLSDCALELQPSFNGFASLTTLYLELLGAFDKTFLHFLSSCPLLKRLTLKCDASTIICVSNFTIVDLFDCLPVIEYLSFWFDIVLCFGADRLPKELPTTLVHLKHLFIQYISFRHMYGLPFVFLLIRSAPNVEKLKLEMMEETCLEEHEFGSVSLKEYSNIMLERLDELEIINFSNAENELDFVKLILAKSPVLKILRICLSDGFAKDEELRISKTLLRLTGASTVVNIIAS